MLRNAWIMQVVTDWMGDDALLVAVDDRIKGFNTLGDLTKLTGRVEAVDDSGEWPEVVLAVEGSNQRGETTATATLRVRLTSRDRGLPKFRPPPTDHGLLAGVPAPEEGPWARVGWGCRGSAGSTGAGWRPASGWGGSRPGGRGTG